MTGNELFAQLVQRLMRYEDAAVLWILLKEQADVREHSTTAWTVANEQLCETVSRAAVQRAVRRLQDQGLLAARTHKNTATLITVNREAVLQLLRLPMPERLPALSQKQFAFLDAWAADSTSSTASTESASSQSGNEHSVAGAALSSSKSKTR